MIMKGKKERFGHWINLGIGMAGAVIGAIIFNPFKIDLGLGAFAITAEDLIFDSDGRTPIGLDFQRVQAKQKSKLSS